MKGKKTKKEPAGKKSSAKAIPETNTVSSVKLPVTKEPAKNTMKSKLPPKQPAKTDLKKTDTLKLSSKSAGRPEEKTNMKHQDDHTKMDTAKNAPTEDTGMRHTSDAVSSSEESAKSDDVGSVKSDSMGDVSFQKVMKKKKVEEKVRFEV